MSDLKTECPSSILTEEEKTHRINDYPRLKYEYTQLHEDNLKLKRELKQANESNTSESGLHKHIVSNNEVAVNCRNCINYGKATQVAKYCSKCTDFSQHKAIN